MEKEIINGKAYYNMKEWTATKIIFWILQAFCVVTITHFVVRFCLKSLDWVEVWHGISLSLLAIFLLCVPKIVHKVFKWYIPNVLIYSAFFLVIANIVIGEVWHVYVYFPIYDKILHTFNGGLYIFFGLSFFGMLCRMPEKNMSISPIVCVVFAFSFSMLLEYFWELYEFALDSMFSNQNMQRWKDAFVGMTEDGNYIFNVRRGSSIMDTMQDMIVHIIGALPVCIYVMVKMKKEQCDFLVRTSILCKKQVLWLNKLNAEALASESDTSIEQTIFNKEKDNCHTAQASCLKDENLQNDNKKVYAECSATLDSDIQKSSEETL